MPEEPEYSDNLEEVLMEDFSLFTEGTEEKRADDFLAGPGTWGVDSKYTKMPGWTGYGIYQAGGACALDYPGFGGWMNTPILNLTGKIIVRFRARPIRKEDTWHGLAVTLLKNPDQPVYADDDCFRYASLNSADWKEFEFVYENTSIEDCFVQFNDGVDRSEEPERLGILIDDIRILRDADYVPAPSGVRASDFTDTSFKLSWNEVAGAASYDVSLLKEVISDEPAILVKEDFNGFSTEPPVWPDGWKPAFGSSPIVEGGTGGSLGMAFRTDDDEVDFPSDGVSRVKSFGCTIYPGKVNPDSQAVVYIFGHEPNYDHWGWLKQVSLAEVPAEGLRIEMGEEDELWRNDAMNISFKYADDGEYAIVDDIDLVFDNKKGLVAAQEKNTKEASLVFEGLDAEADYHYSVCAVKGDKKSLSTEVAKAFGVAVPSVKEATEIDRRGAFTANWEKTPKATGYVVGLYKTVRVSEDTKDSVIMEEDFNKGEVTAAPEDYEWLPGYDQFLYFDDYTDTPGWYSDGAAVCEGMLGCGSSRYGYFNLYTPYMTLHNNNGEFTVEATVWSEAGETFTIQTETQYNTLLFTETGKQKIKAEFQGGKEQQRLMMYTVNGAPFFLDDFKVTQSLEKGALLYSSVKDTEVDASETSLRFSGLESDENILYSYNLKALREERDASCESGVSPMQLVELVPSSIDAVAGEDNETRVAVDGHDIMIYSACGTQVAVYSMQGVKIARESPGPRVSCT